MKIARNLAGVFALLLFLSVSAFAQEDLTKEEWQNQMNTLNEQKQSLTRERDSLQAAVNTLKTTNVQNYDDCINELMLLSELQEGTSIISEEWLVNSMAKL
jgi:uncharacterized protein YlxW (UPF0749 family)